MLIDSRIFIVDDGADYRFLTAQVFTRFLPQYSVRFFITGNELQHFISTTPEAIPDLIILDLHMPGLSGLQTLTSLKAHPTWKHIPVVIMSSTVDKQEMLACYEAGVNSFVSKPQGLTQFKDSFESVCHYWLFLNRIPKATG